MTDANQIDAAVALERRLGELESNEKQFRLTVQGTLSNIDQKLSTIVAQNDIRNGRISKLELAFAEIRDKARDAANFAAGRASVRKQDLAVITFIFSVVSIGVPIMLKILDVLP